VAVTSTAGIDDIASAWTEAIAMVVREQTLITDGERHSDEVAFAVLGLDVDNEARLSTTRWSATAGITKSNSQMSRVQEERSSMDRTEERRCDPRWSAMEGWKGTDGSVLNKLYASARLFVNFFRRPSNCLHSSETSAFKDVRTVCGGWSFDYLASRTSGAI